MLSRLFLLLLLHSCSAQQQETAALVIGGYWANNPGGSVLTTVELYGCAGGAATSIDVASLPRPGYYKGGTYRADVDAILVCGGYNCHPNGTGCAVDATCQTWNPRTKVWNVNDVPSMHAIRESHLMALGPNLDTGATTQHPIAVGHARTSEIYDAATNTWSNYRDIPTQFWWTDSCLIQDQNTLDIYQLGHNLTRIGIRDWSVTDLGPVPPAFYSPGRCASVSIGGNWGIFIHFGFFYDLTAQDWSRKAAPPHYATAGLPNSMWSFRGRPTLFGNRKCDNYGVCIDTEVIQYVAETDTWITLVDLNHSRTYHEVIEVPGAWCDQFVTPTDDHDASTTDDHVASTTDNTIGCS